MTLLRRSLIIKGQLNLRVSGHETSPDLHHLSACPADVHHQLQQPGIAHHDRRSAYPSSLLRVAAGISRKASPAADNPGALETSIARISMAHQKQSQHYCNKSY